MKQTVNIREIRDVANRFEAIEIESCMNLAMANKQNPCYSKQDTEEMMNVLAKASFVRTQVELGLSVGAALRELGNRMRLIQGN